MMNNSTEQTLCGKMRLYGLVVSAITIALLVLFVLASWQRIILSVILSSIVCAVYLLVMYPQKCKNVPIQVFCSVAIVLLAAVSLLIFVPVARLFVLSVVGTGILIVISLFGTFLSLKWGAHLGGLCCSLVLLSSLIAAPWLVLTPSSRAILLPLLGFVLTAVSLASICVLLVIGVFACGIPLLFKRKLKERAERQRSKRGSHNE